MFWYSIAKLELYHSLTKYRYRTPYAACVTGSIVAPCGGSIALREKPERRSVRNGAMHYAASNCNNNRRRRPDPSYFRFPKDVGRYLIIIILFISFSTL